VLHRFVLVVQVHAQRLELRLGGHADELAQQRRLDQAPRGEGLRDLDFRRLDHVPALARPDRDEAFGGKPGQRLACVLNRIDVFTAKISARRSRAGLPAPLAARDACLGPNGLPDTVGAATVKVLSIYPPGSYVRLANSEIAVVVKRGPRADQPKVVSIVAPNGRPMPAPLLRDTAQPRHEIKAAVRTAEVRVAVSHEQVLALQ
jgi:hypothetical protein